VRTDDGLAGRLGPHRDLLLFACGVFAAAYGFAVYNTCFSNFAVQRIGMGPAQYGILESLREVPGLLTAFTMGLFVCVAEPQLAAGAMLLGGVGVAAVSTAHSYGRVVAFSVLWSLGMHLWFTISPSLTLKLAKERAEGRRMGQIAAVSSVAVLAGIGTVRLVSRWAPYHALFIVAGLCLGVGAVFLSRLPPKLGTPDRPKLLFRRRYLLYYTLTFLDGFRRQVFGTFALFALVKAFHTGLAAIAELQLLNTAASIAAAQMAGTLIDRVGERKVLCFNYLVISLLFVGYAFAPTVRVLYALYFLDNLLQVCGMALPTYLKRVAPPDDLMPTLAMGTTINHIAAVTVAAAGGIAWGAFGYKVPFMAGASVAVVSLIMATRVPNRQPAAGG